jgi:hypothetical protein
MGRRTAIFSGGLALLVVGWLWLDVFSQGLVPPVGAPQSGGAGSDIQVLSTLLPSGIQQVVVVDSRQQAMAVYHIEPTLGKIQLRSVRNVRMDLAVEDFNATEPLPREMRLLKQP